MEFFLHIFIYIAIYIILSVSLNLLVGYTGILSIAHAAFYGIGAYIAALMAIRLGSPFLLNLLLAMVASALFGIFIGIPSLRIKDDYFTIATFAFQVIIFSVMNNWVSLTYGPIGIPQIPQPVIFNIEFSSHLQFMILIGILCAVTLWINYYIIKSPFGRVLKAIREDEVYTLALGKNIAAFKIKIFMIAAGLAAISGVMYATYVSYIDPTSFTIMESIFIISIVIIGGKGNLFGPVIGAIVLVSFPELLRYIGMPNSIAANIRQILYGALLVIFILFRPQGIIGKYSIR